MEPTFDEAVCTPEYVLTAGTGTHYAKLGTVQTSGVVPPQGLMESPATGVSTLCNRAKECYRSIARRRCHERGVGNMENYLHEMIGEGRILGA